MHRTRNAAYGQPYRGFESLPLRHHLFRINLQTSKYLNSHRDFLLCVCPCGSVAFRYNPRTACRYGCGWGHMKRLTALAVSKLTKPGRYAVGDGAYLQISEWGTRAWVFRYSRDGRGRHMGLGPHNLITLAEAREKAREARKALLNGKDPLTAKRE